jgi:hypothetical protein
MTTVAAAAVEKMMAGATEEFKPGLKHKPNEKNTCIGEAAAIEKMMAGATEDSKPGLKHKPNVIEEYHHSSREDDGRCNRR